MLTQEESTISEHRFTLWVRKKVEINTDPQRRCYNGCHAHSEWVWTDWEPLCDPRTEEDGEDTMACFQRINPTHEYKLLPREGIEKLSE